MKVTAGRLWIREPLAVFDPGEAPGDSRGGIVIADGRIVERVPAGAEPAAEEVFDARGFVLLPGLVNTHHHFYQTLTRANALAANKPLFPWLEALYPIWAGLTSEMVESATELALCELLLSGCTTSVDHHYVFNPDIEDAVERQVSMAARLGMRVVLTRGSMSLGASAGGLPPDSLVESHDVILNESDRLIAACHDPAEDAMCQIALAPCSPFSVTRELMRDTAVLAAQRQVCLHTHLGETEDENRFCENLFGLRPVDYLEDVGWLSPRTWLAHGIHFQAGEISRLGAAGTGVSHCPSSNMLLGSGTCPVSALERAGVRVGLGVDGSASNDASNLMQEVRQAFLLQRLQPGDGICSHLDALRWATLGGARLLKRDRLGVLEPGALADLALFDLDEPRFSGCEDPLAALVLCGAHRARHVMVGGQWRVSDGVLVNVDLQQVMARHARLARELRER